MPLIRGLERSSGYWALTYQELGTWLGCPGGGRITIFTDRDSREPTMATGIWEGSRVGLKG